MHALIIEDESIIAMAIEDILRDLGFSTFDIAPSAQIAIDAAARRCPDLITSDVQLEPGCGITTVLQICANAVIPVIFITGNLADVTRRAPDFRALSKPFSAAQLSSAVAAALQQYRKGPTLPTAAGLRSSIIGNPLMTAFHPKRTFSLLTRAREKLAFGDDL